MVIHTRDAYSAAPNSAGEDTHGATST